MKNMEVNIPSSHTKPTDTPRAKQKVGKNTPHMEVNPASSHTKALSTTPRVLHHSNASNYKAEAPPNTAQARAFAHASLKGVCIARVTDPVSLTQCHVLELKRHLPGQLRPKLPFREAKRR